MFAITKEGVDADTRVSGPGAAVVPVAFPARVFGQRCGRRGNASARWAIAQELQGDEAARNSFGVIWMCDQAMDPGPPTLFITLRGVTGARGRNEDEGTDPVRRENNGHGRSRLQVDGEILIHLDATGELRGDREANIGVFDDEPVPMVPEPVRWGEIVAETGAKVDPTTQRPTNGIETANERGRRQQGATDFGEHRV